MSLAEANEATAAPQPAERPAELEKPAQLEGRVDAIDGGRVYGWVWDPSHPDERLVVHILANGTTLATTTADKPRIDLRRNGIGDGGHAFDIELSGEAVADPERLTVVAASSETGAEVILRVPTDSQRQAEAAITVPLSLVLDRLDRLVIAQRQLQKAQYDTGQKVHDAVGKLDALLSSESGLSDAVDLVHNRQSEVDKRLDELDVFLMRFDGSLGDFDSRLKTLAERTKDNVKPHLMLLSGFVGIFAGITLYALFAG